MKAGSLLAAAGLASFAAAALACGVCAEDKIAATYDHAVVQHARAQGHAVVYCEIAGRWDASRVKQAASRVRGVDAASIRISREPAAVSFALDTRQQSAQQAVQALRSGLKGGTRVAVLKVENEAR